MTDLQKEAIKRMFRDTVNCPECGAGMREIDLGTDQARWDCGSIYFLHGDEFEQSTYCKKSAKINRSESNAR